MEAMDIAFGCQAGVGKTTAVRYLEKKFGGEILSFAKPIYEIMHRVQDTCGIENVKDRDFLKFIGMWGRKQNEDLWVKLLVDRSSNVWENIFVDDLRFKNEFCALKELGYETVKIVRTGIEHNDDHISERDLLDLPDEEWDYIIVNNGDLAHFHKQLDDLVDSITEKYKNIHVD